MAEGKVRCGEDFAMSEDTTDEPGPNFVSRINCGGRGARAEGHKTSLEKSFTPEFGLTAD
jgi:hypothetical protein